MACHLSKLKIQEIGNLPETFIQDKNVSTQKEIMGVVFHIEIRSLHAQLLCNANSCLNVTCFERIKAYLTQINQKYLIQENIIKVLLTFGKVSLSRLNALKDNKMCLFLSFVN